MIALVEDRTERIIDFNKVNKIELKNNSDLEVFTGAEFEKLSLSLNINDFSILAKFNCILSHRSAMDSNAREALKKFCNKNKRFLVFFSGGNSSKFYIEKPFPSLVINVKQFYSPNLVLFLDHYKKTGICNLQILEFGNRWELAILLNLRNKIAVHLSLKHMLSQGIIKHQDLDEFEELNRYDEDSDTSSCQRIFHGTSLGKKLEELSIIEAPDLTVLTEIRNLTQKAVFSQYEKGTNP